MKKLIQNLFFITTFVVLIISGCKKEDAAKTGYLSPNIKYPTNTITVTTGRGIIRTSALSIDQSTLPLECSIVAIKDANGNVLQNLMDYKVNTYYWKGSPTGLETSFEQVDSMRTPVTRPAFDINPGNGQVIIWGEAKDTTLFPKGTYILDVKVKNSSGEKVLTNALTINTTPAGPYSYQFSGVDGIEGLDVTIKRIQTSGNKLIVRTLKNDGTPIDPKTLQGYNYGSAAVPNLKDWHNLGLQKVTSYTEFPDRLEIEVGGVPIPLIGGLPAGQGIPVWGQRIDMYNNGDAIGKYFNYWFDFGIFESGTWEIVIKLKY